MREIHVDRIRETVKRLCTEATTVLPEDVLASLREAREREESELGRTVLDEILANADIAAAQQLPLCQDTGTSVIFLEVGQDVHIAGGDLSEALRQGVSDGYSEGRLRSSIVDRPFSARINTKDNTPPVVHTEIVPGDKLRIKLMPKGSGCENMSRFTTLLPGQGAEGVTQFVLDTVDQSGGNPCPPIIVGVGIGGTAEHAMYLAKKAITRRVGDRSPDAETAELEADLLEKVNALGVGPQAVGGRSTALSVNVETYPTHIAALPVAVNIQCHSARLKEATL